MSDDFNNYCNHKQIGQGVDIRINAKKNGDMKVYGRANKLVHCEDSGVKNQYTTGFGFSKPAQKFIDENKKHL
jgi:hypothetical protein